MGAVDMWMDLESWLASNRPWVLSDLRSPASEAEIESLRAVVGAPLPSGLIDSYRLHDGEDFEAEYVFGGLRRLLPIGLALQQLTDYERSARKRGTLDAEAWIRTFGPVRPYDWSAAWCPFLLDNDVVYCVDMNPADGGVAGQIIIVDHEGLALTKIADSFELFFEAGMMSVIEQRDWPFLGQRRG